MVEGVIVSKNRLQPGYILNFKYRSINTPHYILSDIQPLILYLGKVPGPKGVLLHGVNLHYLTPYQLRRLTNFVKPRVLRLKKSTTRMGTSFKSIEKVFEKIVDIDIQFLLRRYANRGKLSMTDSYEYYHSKLKRVIGDFNLEAYRTYYSQNCTNMRVLDDRFIVVALRRQQYRVSKGKANIPEKPKAFKSGSAAKTPNKRPPGLY